MRGHGVAHSFRAAACFHAKTACALPGRRAGYHAGAIQINYPKEILYLFSIYSALNH